MLKVELGEAKRKRSTLLCLSYVQSQACAGTPTKKMMIPYFSNFSRITGLTSSFSLARERERVWGLALTDQLSSNTYRESDFTRWDQDRRSLAVCVFSITSTSLPFLSRSGCS